MEVQTCGLQWCQFSKCSGVRSPAAGIRLEI